MNAPERFTRSGLVLGMPADLYHAGPPNEVSNTMLSAIKKSPLHCYALHLDPARPANSPTAAMKAGTLAHTAILEPSTLAARYVVRPADLDGRTKEGKAWAAEHAGRDIITADELLKAETQREAILSVPELRSALASGHAESSVFWEDESTGLRCRARPDWIHFQADGRAIVVDIKTTADITPEEFSKSVAKYGYHRQAAHYTSGLRAVGVEVAAFIFGAVSGSYPFAAVPYVLDAESFNQGADEVAELLELFAECRRLGTWPAYYGGVQLLSLPSWARRSAEIEVSYANT